VIDADYPTLKDKVNGIEENANNYQHPDKHPTSILEGIDTELGAEDKFLNKKGEFTTIQTSSIGVTGSELYLSVQDSDIAGYKLLSNTIDAVETEITITANISQGIVWGNKYLTPEYTATTIPAKSWGFDYWRKVSTALNNSSKHLRVFVYRGGIETDIISLTSPDINDTDFVEREVAYTLGAIELQQGDRIGVQEGFVMIFGEKHRKLIETQGEKLIELGLKNGKYWTTATILKDCKVSTIFEMLREGEIEQKKIDTLENDMKSYFTTDEIIFLKNEYSSDIKDDASFYMDGVKKIQSLFIKKISDSDVNVISPKSFKYFNKFVINNKYKITLYGEGGLGLDSYSKNNLQYYKDENELCYMIEDIALKYHYFGMLLAKENEAELWIEKIKNNLSINTNRYLQSNLTQTIYRLVKNEDYADEIIIDIQNTTGVIDNFMTHKQIKERISKMDFSKLPENLFKQ
jgi:hypothetical protein